MSGKTPVTVLQEYCAKNKLEFPTYNVVDAGDGTKCFECVVNGLGTSASGIGRSKKEAKHDAADNLIKKTKSIHKDIMEIPQALHETIPTLESPTYNVVDAGDGTKCFECVVNGLGTSASGIGRSKKEAKHDAADNLIKKTKSIHKDIMEIPQALHETIPTYDAIVSLRDICVSRNHPLPYFTVVAQTGSPEAPEFKVKAEVASIVRFAKCSTKKVAKQLAAQKLINVILQCDSDIIELQIIPIDEAIKNQEDKNKKKIQTYRELKESDIKETCVRLSDRHNYFKNLDKELKEKAEHLFRKTCPYNPKEVLIDILSILEIKYKERTYNSKVGELIFFEFVCDFDAVFCAKECEIYRRIIGYLKDMLN